MESEIGQYLIEMNKRHIRHINKYGAMLLNIHHEYYNPEAFYKDGCLWYRRDNSLIFIRIITDKEIEYSKVIIKQGGFKWIKRPR